MAHVTLQHALRSLAAHLDAALKANPQLPCLPDVVVDVHTRDGRAAVWFDCGQDVAIQWARELHVQAGHKLTLGLVDQETGEVHYEFKVGEQRWRFVSVPDAGAGQDDTGPICYSIVADPPDPSTQDTEAITPVVAVKAVA
jgi:hypothetical protein